MQQMLQRALLYGSAVLSLGGLGYAVQNGHADADVTTLLSSADVQLRLAYAMGPVDKNGVPLPAHAELLACADRFLADVERIEPGRATAAEFRGFLHMLRGQFREAAASYERAQQCQDVQDEQRDVLAFNQARMLAKAGDRQGAVDVFGRHAQALDARYGHQRSLEEATLLREMGQRDAAKQRLDRVSRDPAAKPMASLQAGVEYLALGHRTEAEAALQRAAAEVAIADYHLAQLKLQQGEVDKSMQLLERVAKAQPAEVRRRLHDEVAVWSAVSGDARFQQLTGSLSASPMR
jgi:tetratricopeptide (TPR) repeat protein